jgi:hypothetical protein
MMRSCINNSITATARVFGVPRVWPQRVLRMHGLSHAPRGLTARDEARRTREYVDADEVLGELEGMLGAVRATGVHG